MIDLVLCSPILGCLAMLAYDVVSGLRSELATARVQVIDRRVARIQPGMRQWTDIE
jgi:hypothetical protein